MMEIVILRRNLFDLTLFSPEGDTAGGNGSSSFDADVMRVGCHSYGSCGNLGLQSAPCGPDVLVDQVKI